MALALLMRLIIELDSADDGEIVFAAQHEIEVLGADAIEGLLAVAVAQTSMWLDDVCNTNLAKDAIFLRNRLLKNTEKRALRRREQSLFLSIRESFGLAALLFQLRDNRHQHKKHNP